MIRGWLKSLPPHSRNPHGAGPSSNTFCGMSVLRSACFLVPRFVPVFRSSPEDRVVGAAAARLQESAVPLYLDTTTLIGSQCLCLLCVSVREVDARMPHLSEWDHAANWRAEVVHYSMFSLSLNLPCYSSIHSICHSSCLLKSFLLFLSDIYVDGTGSSLTHHSPTQRYAIRQRLGLQRRSSKRIGLPSQLFSASLKVSEMKRSLKLLWAWFWFRTGERWITWSKA